MKDRYTLIDHKTNRASKYSAFLWNLAWFAVMVIGMMNGFMIAMSIYK